MYEKFYGLTGKPFQLNPDPRFYFNSSQHRRAMAFVEYGLHQSEGFIVVTGEIGAGKTTVVRSLLNNLDSDRVVAANIVTTQVDADDLLRLVGAAFGVRTREATDKANLLMSIEAVLASHARDGKRCVLIVDEAQNLTNRAVEELRMLSNFQLGTDALLQSFLVGQPEFRQMLQGADMSQMRQRVIAACHIGPMDLDETRAYVEHRLRLAGWTNCPTITAGAFVAAHEATCGVPRRINLLFDRALLAGFIGERRVISEDNVREVAAEIFYETAPADAPRRRASDRGAAAPGATGTRAGVVDIGSRARAPRRTEEAALDPDAEATLRHLEADVRGLQESIARVERGNQATLSLFKRFVDWMRAQEETARVR
ncbi:MAG TPA: XrtA/PEP-CTERM system-associated ATPase [Usitatibacter sp.]|jgi:putative secretion ATPase (PEP-CTERM system associated)|nr:XrtA/PEP-CTERM system-associated ATPase [Usitatibacter sp.]